MDWLNNHRLRISLGTSVALIGVGTVMAFVVTVWGLLPRRPVESRMASANHVIDLLSGVGTNPAWFVGPLAISTTVLFPFLVAALAKAQTSRFPWIGAAAAGAIFAVAATSVTGFLLGAEMALWLETEPGDPGLSVPTRMVVPLLGAGMAPPVAFLLMPLHLIAGGAFYGMLVAAFVTPVPRQP
jgi:hypothetical protein